MMGVGGSSYCNVSGGRGGGGVGGVGEGVRNRH